MKKVWKGFAAAVSAAAIAATGFIGATSANAADGDVTVTITDATSADQKFVAYRVLDATNNGDNYAYTINTKYSEQLKTATELPLMVPRKRTMQLSLSISANLMLLQ